MSQQSNSAVKLYLYVVVITVISGAALSFIYNGLKGMHAANKEAARKADILSAVPETKTEQIADPSAVFKERIKVIAVRPDGTKIEKLEEVNTADRAPIAYKDLADIDLATEDKLPLEKRVYPLYEYKGNAGQNYYIAAIRGNGLWDKIWGYIAFEADLNTIAGVFFGHKGETPGLGAEIKDSDAFKQKFVKKQIYKGNEYVSVTVRKKVKQPNHELNSISGATVTSDGVTEMMDRGLKNYLAYFEKIKKG